MIHIPYDPRALLDFGLESITWHLGTMLGTLRNGYHVNDKWELLPYVARHSMHTFPHYANHGSD